MRIGVTYDLRSDYLAMGYGAEETAEFDSPVTIDAICEALTSLGYEPVRIGHIRDLVARLAAGERWDGVFNICEGLKGLAREAQVPALLEAYDIPYVFSDPLTLSLSLDKAMAKRVVRSAGRAHGRFRADRNARRSAEARSAVPALRQAGGRRFRQGRRRALDGRNAAASSIRSSAICFRRFDQPVLVETFLSGREFTVGITGTGADATVLGVTEIRPKPNFVGHGYGYANKETGWEDKVDIVLADPRQRQGRRQGGAGRLAGAQMPRRRAHRHPLRRGRQAAFHRGQSAGRSRARTIPICA